MSIALPITPTDARQRIELARWAWLDTKSKQTGSAHTAQLTHDADGRPVWRGAYAAILDHFRRTVQRAGLDLDGDPSALALLAQSWAGSSWTGGGRVIAAATYNQRLAIVASFYTYARRHQLLIGDNPIDRVERRPVQVYATARALDAPTARGLLSHIDRTTLDARSWTESYRQLQAHQELLSDDALTLLDQAITRAQADGNADAITFYSEHRNLLQRCREVGVEDACAEKLGMTVEQFQGGGNVNRAVDIPLEVRPLLDRIEQLNRITDMPIRVELCRQALALVSPGTDPQLWAALQDLFANSLVQNPKGDHAANLDQAIAAYHQALTVLTHDAMPIDWAMTITNLATAYQDRIRGDRAANLEQATIHYQQALTVFQPHLLPKDCRQTASNLGSVYAELRRWHEATTAYMQALAGGGDAVPGIGIPRGQGSGTPCERRSVSPCRLCVRSNWRLPARGGDAGAGARAEHG